MDSNHFVTKFRNCLFFDALCLVLVPILGYMPLMGFLLYSPFLMLDSARGAMAWLKESHPRRCIWWALGRAMSGSGLIFLLAALVLHIWPSPETGDIWEQVLFIFLILAVYRGVGAAYLNMLVGPVVIFKGKDRLTKLDGAASILCSASGLYMWNQLLASSRVSLSSLVGFEGAQDYSVYAFMLAYFVVSYLNGLAWGGVLHWLVRNGSSQSLAPDRPLD